MNNYIRAIIITAIGVLLLTVGDKAPAPLQTQQAQPAPVAAIQEPVVLPAPVAEAAVPVEVPAIEPPIQAIEKPIVYAVGCELYRPLISQYGWNVSVAMRVMQAESGCNPNAANWTDSHSTCNGSFGLFQIACFSGQVYDPAQNIAIAYQKYQARGWQPWGVCNRGIVNCY
jgi:hypothetical protein